MLAMLQMSGYEWSVIKLNLLHICEASFECKMVHLKSQINEKFGT